MWHFSQSQGRPQWHQRQGGTLTSLKVQHCLFQAHAYHITTIVTMNLKIKMYEAIILPVVLYGWGTLSLALREEFRLKIFENRILSIWAQEEWEWGGYKASQWDISWPVVHGAMGRDSMDTKDVRRFRETLTALSTVSFRNWVWMPRTGLCTSSNYLRIWRGQSNTVDFLNQNR